MTRNQTLAIIPARGGSKGIHRKNVRILAGRPMIAWTIDAACRAHSVDRVIVSTDDAEIAEVALAYGAEAVARPPEISGDNASSEAALLHTLEHLETLEGYLPDLLVFLQCTSPLTTAEDIDGTIERLECEQADTAFAVAATHQYLWRIDETGEWQGVNHDKSLRQMRQQRDAEYLETGAVYVMRTEGFRRARHRFFGKTTAYVMPRARCCEVDAPQDLLIAEALLGLKRWSDGLPFRPHAIIFDFDGVMTDNTVWVDERGSESVRCNRSDGFGLESLRHAGIPMLILSKERNAVVAARAKKLGIAVIQGADDKLTILQSWAKQSEFALSKAYYVGNDVNDLGCMKMVGLSVAVADAHSEVKKSADLVLTRPGGRGAVRELADRILTEFASSVDSNKR